ncbi:MAG: hypothetical protein PHQ96_06370 [Candidatus Omnitrophica bacterium]|nr:hypothetical protein [Candidatus Omnitrophota bacterium]
MNFFKFMFARKFIIICIFAIILVVTLLIIIVTSETLDGGFIYQIN